MDLNVELNDDQFALIQTQYRQIAQRYAQSKKAKLQLSIPTSTIHQTSTTSQTSSIPQPIPQTPRNQTIKQSRLQSPIPSPQTMVYSPATDPRTLSKPLDFLNEANSQFQTFIDSIDFDFPQQPTIESVEPTIESDNSPQPTINEQQPVRNVKNITMFNPDENDEEEEESIISTTQELRLLNRGGDYIETLNIETQNKTPSPIYVYDKGSFNLIKDLAIVLKTHLKKKHSPSQLLTFK